MPLEFRPNYEKIIELLLYLAHKKPGVDKYQAVKFFYLADKEHINRFGRPITYETYFALRYGPVASKAKELIEGNKGALKKAGLERLPIETRYISRRGPDKNDIIVISKPLRDVDYSIFSKSDLIVFDEVLSKYGNLDFDALYKITHEHLAYKKAWANRGWFQRALMDYADMIELPKKREQILMDIGPIANHI